MASGLRIRRFCRSLCTETPRTFFFSSKMLQVFTIDHSTSTRQRLTRASLTFNEVNWLWSTLKSSGILFSTSPFFLLLLLLVRFHFFLLWIWEPVCDQSGFWSSSISNKSERPWRDYVNAWWQQPGCDAGRGGEGAGCALPCACATALMLG